MNVKFASTPNEIDRIIELRYKILREPWAQPKDTATDGNESHSHNAYIEDGSGNMIACGRLQLNNETTGQIRYMAVDADQQGKGLGKIILKALEEKGKELGLKKIELQARENALEFYRINKYDLKEKTFLLWNIIQHYLMEKEL